MADPDKVEIYVSRQSKRMLVRTVDATGAPIDGVPFHFLSAEESERFELSEGQFLMIGAKPEQET